MFLAESLQGDANVLPLLAIRWSQASRPTIVTSGLRSDQATVKLPVKPDCWKGNGAPLFRDYLPFSCLHEEDCQNVYKSTGFDLHEQVLRFEKGANDLCTNDI